jgi:hypothetical protein
MFSRLLERASIKIEASVPLEVREKIFGVRAGYRAPPKKKAGDSFVSDPIYLRQGRDRRAIHETWYRGENWNFLGTKVNFAERDAIDNYILYGWLPKAPFIKRSDFITAFGSCFARHVTNYLKKRGYAIGGRDKVNTSYVIRCGEGMVNTFAILQQFQWAYGIKEFDENLWYDSKGDVANYIDSIRDETLNTFNSTNVFIITLGLSEVWYDKQTGDVFWRAIPKAKYDPERHGFKVSTIEENRANIREIISIIKKNQPSASIIFTLSPVPLVATFRPVSCVTANAVSKAILRVAVDEVMREYGADGNVFYFPSYEIVKDFFKDPFERDNHHVRPELVVQIMDLFAKYYLVPETPAN